MKKFKVANKQSLPSRSSGEQFTRQAILLGILTLALLALFFFFGIPFLIRLTTLWDKQKPPPAEEAIAPLPPRFTGLPEATNSATLILNGLADPDSIVALYDGATLSATTKSDKQGSFRFDHVVLRPGANTFWATAEKNKQKSKASEKYIVNFDNQPPQLKIEKPADTTSISYQETIEIQGQTDPNTRLTINNHLILVDSQGHFAAKMDLASGDNKFVVQAEDSAGNITKKTIIVTYHP